MICMRKWEGNGLMNDEIERVFECEYNSEKKRMQGFQAAFISTEWRHEPGSYTSAQILGAEPSLGSG
jgi:hypothetical protein